MILRIMKPFQIIHHIVIDHIIKPLLKYRICYTWQRSKINTFNRLKKVILCPYCGSSRSEKISTWKINDHYGLFDDNKSRLKVIYAIDLIPKILSEDKRSVYRKKIFDLISSTASVDYHKCPDCNLVFQNYPHKREFANYYYRELYRLMWQKSECEDMDPVYGRSDDRWVYQQEAIAKYFLDVTCLKKKSKILDLGCAEGVACRYLEDNGMISYGLEPSIPMANYAKEVLGLNNILCNEYTTDAYPANSFDGIFSHHVAEHIVDIKEFFKGIKTHLKKNGFLLLQVPCFDNLKTDKDLDQILQGGHIYCFSEKFLVSMLEQLDFTILDIKKTPCNINELPKEQVGKWETTIWADDPCGITILARKEMRV